MKKLIALTLALLMLTMSFVACNEGTADVTTEAENNSTEAPVETTVEATDAPVATDAPTQTNAPAQTEAPAEKKGCGGFSTYAILTVLVCGACLSIKRKEK
jgi:hypothetical protein